MSSVTDDLAPSAGRSAAPAVILVVEADEDERFPVLTQLLRRYGADYEIMGEPSAALARQRLVRLSNEEREVAMVLSDHQLPDGSGLEFLAASQGQYPDAKRAVLVTWAETYAADQA